MGANHSRDIVNGEKRRHKKNNSTTLTSTTNRSTSSIANISSKDVTRSVSSPINTPHVTYQDTIDNEGFSASSSPKYSPFYKRTTSKPASTAPCNPVNPVRHQVVLSDQAMPLSPLASVSKHLRRRNSNNKTDNDNNPSPQVHQRNSSSGGSGRRLSLHGRRSYQKQQQQDYDTVSAASALTSDDDESRTNPSSSRSALYSSSVDSSSSMHTSPIQPHFLPRRLSFNNDFAPPNLTHNGKAGNIAKYGSIVFDTTVHTTDPLPSLHYLQRQQEQQQQQMRPRRPSWVYDYGHEKEYNRQLRQHYVLKQVFGGNIFPELTPSPRRILDSACGIGLWTWETSQQYSHCNVIGIDINLPEHQSGPWGLSTPSAQGQQEDTTTFMPSGSNVSFMYGDILRPLPFEDDYFDFIHQREGGTFIPFDHWPTLLKEFHRILKVGGKLQLVEHDILFKNPGPILAMINEWYRIAADGIGVKSNFSQVIKEKLLSAGFDQVEVIVYDIPIGEWSNDPVQKQHGFLYKELVKALFKSVQKWWLIETGITQQEYERVCVEAMDEFEDYNSSVTWKIFTARKATPCHTASSTC